MYLASPYVVAASAIAGHIVAPEEFLREREEELVGA
jgi:homoaconitase/3-isopropylmalate dehydratase large subunit